MEECHADIIGRLFVLTIIDNIFSVHTVLIAHVDPNVNVPSHALAYLTSIAFKRYLLKTKRHLTNKIYMKYRVPTGKKIK